MEKNSMSGRPSFLPWLDNFADHYLYKLNLQQQTHKNIHIQRK
jgi:hypothetical protein